MKYLLGSGYYRPENSGYDLFKYNWAENTAKAAPAPNMVVIICAGHEAPETVGAFHPIQALELRMGQNLGHVGDLLNGSKAYEFCGWSASVLALALLAYNAELDLLYKESDALAFGPWVERMYADMGDGDMVFGRKMNSPPYMACSQSLFLIRHRFLPAFVASYIAMGKDGDPHNLPETKFAKLEEIIGTDRIKRLSFGVDRERPIPWDDEVFFAQKWTDEELNEAKRRELI